MINNMFLVQQQPLPMARVKLGARCEVDTAAGPATKKRKNGAEAEAVKLQSAPECFGREFG